MANKVIKYDSFKRGETPTFYFDCSQPYEGFSWTGITGTIVLTNLQSPNDNTGAGVKRESINPSVDPATNIATYSMKPTVEESKALLPNITYKVELKLMEGTENVVKPITGEVKVIQDYAI
ncbi:MAG: hypothetical protein EOO27_02365 [Comamonadaceae bacterium]|nr:MAG: hypothetical protein EOO27_02365 [Comamonadaceae bacterium]